MKNRRVSRCREAHRTRTLLDALEPRVLLSVVGYMGWRTRPKPMTPAKRPPRVTAPIHVGKKPIKPAANAAANYFTPSQILHAYGFDQVAFGMTNGGAGQTIAIVDAYHYPTALADLQHFDAQYGLPDPPSFKQVAQDGTTNFPPTDPSGPGSSSSWEIEEALDIEWAHVIAPAANIILVETNDNSTDSLLNKGVGYARTIPGVSVISMSFGQGEFGSELTYENNFTTPSGHIPITFVAATGDQGAPGNYPAFSSNVLAVGGTSLTLDASGNYASESAWSGSGGGFSFIVGQPTYQKGIAASASLTRRTIPDVSMVADPNTGVVIYDSYDFPSSPSRVVGGTSLATPLWAGLIAVADQGRVAEGLTTLNGSTQTLPMLYSMPASNFHDITTGASTKGSTTYAATPGYDLATGRGSPIANKVIYGLMGSGSIAGSVFQDNNSNNIGDGADVPLANVQVYIDSNNNGVYDPGTITTVSNTTAKAIPDNNSAGATSTINISGTTSTVSNISVTLNITHPRDADLTTYLIAPDGSEILLFSALTGTNFSATILNDQATQSIGAGSGSFTGTFYPADAMADFNGESANGNWSLMVVDNRSGMTGTLNSWSLSVTTGPADLYATTTDASGHYAFGNLPLGSPVTVREVTPAGYVQAVPPAATGLVVTPLFAGAVGNISNFPLLFSAPGDTDAYTLSVDPSDTYLQISTGTSATNPSAYRVPIANLPQLTFTLTGNHSVLVLDFSNGSPLSLGNIQLNMVAGSNEELRVFGNSPSQTFTLNDTQFALVGGGAVLYTAMPNLTLATCTVNASGDLNGVDNINVNSGATLNF